MKECPKCKELIDDDALFCPNCGTKIGNTKTCIKCGKEIEADSAFCPHCGASQIEDVPEPEQPTESHKVDFQAPPVQKKGVPKNHANVSYMHFAIFMLLLLLGAAVLALFYFINHNDPVKEEYKEYAERTDIKSTETTSEESAENRIYEIFMKGLRMQSSEAVNTFFSQDFRKLYNEVEAIDAVNPYIGFWPGSLRDGGQDFDADRIEIERIYNVSNNRFDADISLIHEIEFNNRNTETFHFVFENGNWYIDDNMNNKDNMKEYIKYNTEEPVSLEEYSHKVEGLEVQLSTDEEANQIIEIFKNGQLFQRMESGEEFFALSYSGVFEHVVYFVDANFDGETDIFIGTAEDRSISSLLLWNPDEGKFVRYNMIFLNPLFFPLSQKIIQGGYVTAFESCYSLYLWIDGMLIERESLTVINDMEDYDFDEMGKINNYKLSKKYTIVDTEQKIIISESNEISDLPYWWQKPLVKYKQLFGGE